MTKGGDDVRGSAKSGQFMRRAADHSGSGAVPLASLNRRAQGVMTQPLRADLFRSAIQPHEIEKVFVPRTYNFIEDDGPADVPPRRPRKEPEAVVRPSDVSERTEPPAGPPPRPRRGAPSKEGVFDQPLEADEDLDLPDLEEYDGSDLLDADEDVAEDPLDGEEDLDDGGDPDEVPPPSERLPSALLNKRNYYENSDETRKGSGLLGGILPSGKPSGKTGGKSARSGRTGRRR